ncbi:MAG: tetratricopeptide repeat protein [Promethearchaeota archaeon]|nr:MAG: tetratricopeptide repeat protein [Candidatus Lokiarchaeota archaeon]
MTQEELEQLTRAEELFENGNLDDAYSLLEKLAKENELGIDKKVHILYLMGLISVYQHKGEDAIDFGEQISSEAHKFKRDLLYLDGLFLKLVGLVISDKFEQTSDILQKADALLNSISNKPKDSLKLRKSRIIIVKAWIAFHSGKIKEAEKMIQTILNLMKNLDDNLEKAWAYLLLAQIHIQITFQLDLAMEYSKKALSIAKNIRFNHYWIAYSYIGIAVSYGLTYEYGLSLEFHMKSLEIFQKLDNKWYICNILNNIGLTYCDKGDYKLSMKYLEESLMLWEKYKLNIGAVLDSLVYVALEIGDVSLAQKYFNRLEERYKQKKEDTFRKVIYQYNKAVLLKRSSRIRDIAKSEKLLKQIAQDENAFFDYRLYAYIHLCDILVTEFRLNYEDVILDELNAYIPKLLRMAEESRSYLVFCETFILQAKLALLKFDINSAQRFLTQAQKIAETKQIKRLAIKISYEHDKLIEQIDLWKNLKESDIPISERWRLVGLNEQMEIMKKKGLQDVPEILDEKPVYLLIISQGGMPFFSQSFTNDKKFEEHLFGGFFITLNSFIMQNFSEGLNRASFGEYTLLMNDFSPFLSCYIFKGQSYSAQKRIISFLNEIKNDRETWKSFNEFYQMNREIGIKDIPHLEFLIQETFPLN